MEFTRVSVFEIGHSSEGKGVMNVVISVVLYGAANCMRKS